MESKISDKKKSSVFTKAISTGLIEEEETSVIFYDISFIEQKIKTLQESFPKSSLHAIAVKSNPLIKILELLKEMNVGAEVASLPELYIAEKTGFASNKIIFDSPAKTKNEIEYAIKLGTHINIDSLQELEIIDELRKKISSKSTFGIRINPQVGAGSIASTSVGDEYSKFGVPIKEYKSDLTAAFLRYDWLKGIHLHVGSQGCPVDLLLEGIEVVYYFALELNEKLIEQKKEPVSIFDIGGGLPVSYRNNEKAVSINEYAEQLKKHFPDLFNDKYKLITEFGRTIYANSGWTVSRVENVKFSGNTKTAVIHVGADLLLRRAYSPNEWHHNISVIDNNGNLKSGKDIGKYIIAGPLCFAGDLVAKNVELPQIEKGDFIIIHDTGAYTLSMWSRYNSRQIPKVIGYYNDGEKFLILKERESLDDIYKFWS